MKPMVRIPGGGIVDPSYWNSRYPRSYLGNRSFRRDRYILSASFCPLVRPERSCLVRRCGLSSAHSGR